MRILPLIVTGVLWSFLASPASAQDAAAIYTRSCVSCHGATGAGDTPMGKAMKTPDMSDSERMAKVSDSTLAHVISNGSKAMPKFPALSADQVKALVVYIRTFSAKP